MNHIWVQTSFIKEKYKLTIIKDLLLKNWNNVSDDLGSHLQSPVENDDAHEDVLVRNVGYYVH